MPWALLLASGLASEDCGIVPGDRWWIVRGALVSDDGTRILRDWRRCDIPVGVTLSLRVEERPGPTVVLRVVPPCDGGAVWQQQQTARALAYLAERGVARESVEIRVEACAADPSLNAEVGQQP
jgi:hypothetical protein